MNNSRNQRKVFCIGRNKTGTTSLGRALQQLGYRLGSQSAAELLFEDWVRRDFRSLIELCRTADAFQDVPFCLDYTFQALDAAFPGSRFILSVRNSATEWYESFVRFHSKVLGLDRPPTADDLKSLDYVYRGWEWRVQQAVYGIDEATLYDREIYTQRYLSHIQYVVEYFRHRTDDLLVLNLADEDSSARLCQFLGRESQGFKIPHLNRSV